MGQMSLRGVSKAFGAVTIIPSLDLDIAEGEFVVFVGPSGCGKSTLLRLIAGLEDVTSRLDRDRRRRRGADCRPASAAFPWCSSPMRSIRI